jgi:hypothetical protein
VDFVIRFDNGFFLCKTKIQNRYKSNHLNATSFSTREDAEKALKILRFKNARVMVRRTTLGD